MFCKVKIKDKEYNCYYETNGKIAKQPLVILHGWGVNCSIFKSIINELNYYTISIDFIGFGKSDNPIIPFTLDDYVEQLHQIVKYLKLQNISILGHSFGGRVAIKYNYYYNLNTLILVDSAGIKHRTFVTYKKIIKYKLLKKYYYIFHKNKYNILINNSGSNDYKVLLPVMKQTMNKIITIDLKKYCKTTRTNTLILWGVNDTETPISDSYIFHKIFFNQKLIIFYKSGHFPFLDEKEKFIRVLNRAISNDYFI